MSIKLMALVFDLPLKPKHKLVMLCLSNYASDDGRNVYPSLTTLQAKTSLSRPAVTSAINDLKADQFVGIESAGNVRRLSNHYQIDVKRLESLLTSKRDLLVNGVYQSLVNAIYRTSKRDLPDPSVSRQSDPLSSVRAERKRAVPKSEDTCPKDWMARLYLLCGVDPAIVSSGLHKRISDAGKAIIKAGGTLEQVDRFERWWASDAWRREHTPCPKPEQVRDNWAQARKGKYGDDRAATNIIEPTDAQRRVADEINRRNQQRAAQR